jgi:hypothetical protein
MEKCAEREGDRESDQMKEMCNREIEKSDIDRQTERLYNNMTKEFESDRERERK